MTDFTTVKKNLESKRFRVSTFATAEEAADYLDRSIDGVSVGIGGSVTAEEAIAHFGLKDAARTPVKKLSPERRRWAFTKNCPDITGCSGTGVRSQRRTPAERP